ncbi:MAG: acyl dehydratase [Brevundimonas sp.]
MLDPPPGAPEPWTPSEPLLVHFEDWEVGQVSALGVCAVDPAALALFVERFAPGHEVETGAPEAMVYALWAGLAAERARGWAQTKTLAVDALRFSRNPPPGELLRGRMTVMGKDPVGDGKGILIAQHDLLDEAGRLVFSCLTRTLFARR